MASVVAVTGATGFIGQHVVRHLLPSGRGVRALVRSPARCRALPESVERVSGDLGAESALRDLLGGAETLIHCAGAVRAASPGHFRRVNCDGLARIARIAAEQRPPPRLLLLSSLAAREPQLSSYAASKRAAEEVLRTRYRAGRWNVLRPPAVYGPEDRELLPLFRLMGRGLAPVLAPRDARFSMLYVGDLAAAVLRWVECEEVPIGMTYTLDDGREGAYRWDDVIATVARICRRPVRRLRLPRSLLMVMATANAIAGRALGYAPMLTPGKVRELGHVNWVCDNAAIARDLAWSPKVSLTEGLRATPGWCPHGTLD